MPVHKLALGVALVSCVLGVGRASAQAPLSATQMKALEASIDRALTAYNRQDAKAFYVEWTSAFRLDRFTDYYLDAREKVGNYVSRKIGKDDSVLEGEAPLLAYEAKFSKAPRVRLVVHFTKDGSATRILNIEIETM
jgi:hypothetical protein